MAAANENALSELHRMMAEMMKEEIEACRDAGIPMSASDKAVIIKFLKDNNITCDVTSEELADLHQGFADELAIARAKRQEKLANKLASTGTDDLSGIL